MIPGQAYNIEVSLPFTNYTWETGHKIKAYISGNSASRWDVNLQNGDSMYVAGDTNIANITIHHGAMGLSKMTFPGPTGTVSIQEGITGPTLHVFPNPVQNTLSIEVSGTPTHFEVLDLAGRIQMSGKFQRRLDVSAIPKGIHILYIRTEDNSFRKKFVKL